MTMKVKMMRPRVRVRSIHRHGFGHLTYDQQHFTQSCPELGFAIPLDSEDIDQADSVSSVTGTSDKSTHA